MTDNLIKVLKRFDERLTRLEEVQSFVLEVLNHNLDLENKRLLKKYNGGKEHGEERTGN